MAYRCWFIFIKKTI